MSYQVFARKWRPTRFDQVVGQEHVLRALRNALDRGVAHHAFLFTGTRGVGKTTLARIMARCLNCGEGPTSTPCGECDACREIDKGCYVDLIEVDAASRARVEETRELMDNVSYAPISGRYRVYLIDEVHMFSNHSFNALLKVLEEPPDHVRFLLATTEPKRVPVTVLSRCVQFHLRLLGVGEISRHVRYVLEEENIPCDPAAADMIAATAGGSLRDALSLLEQAVSDGEGELREDRVRAMIGTIPGTDLRALMRAVVDGDGKALLDCLKSIAAKQPDFSTVLSDLMVMLQRAAIGHLSRAGEADGIEDNPALRLSPEEIQLLYQIALYGRRDLQLAPDPCGGFEMCLIRMLAFKPAGESGAGVSAGAPAAGSAEKRERPPSPGGRPKTPAQSGGERNAAADDPGAALSPVPGYWADWVRRAELSGMVKQLALNCAVESYDNGVLRLGLARSHQPLLVKRNHLRAALLPLMAGSDLRLEIELRESSTPTLAQWEERERNESLDQARRQLENDPNIHAMRTEFGAVVQPESIQVEDTSRLRDADHAGASPAAPAGETDG